MNIYCSHRWHRVKFSIKFYKDTVIRLMKVVLCGDITVVTCSPDRCSESGTPSGIALSSGALQLSVTDFVLPNPHYPATNSEKLRD